MSHDDNFFMQFLIIFIILMVIGLWVGVLILALMDLKITDASSLRLSEETLNDICYNLTNNSASVGESIDEKLICKIPSYDHTQNIIIKSNEVGE